MSDAINVITSPVAIRCRGQVNLLGIPQYGLHPVLLFPTQATFINFPEGFVVWFLLVIADIVFFDLGPVLGCNDSRDHWIGRIRLLVRRILPTV